MKRVFKMRPEPKAPVRFAYSNQVSLIEGATLEELIQKLPEGTDLSKVTVGEEKDYGYGEDCSYEMFLQYPMQEDDESLQTRVEAYNKKLTLWKKWYEANEVQIMSRQAEEQKSKEEKALRKEELHKKWLERQIKDAQKTIERNSKLLAKKAGKK